MDLSEEVAPPGRPGPRPDGLGQLLDHYPDPAWIYDLKSLRLVMVNGALSSVTEYPRDELLRMNLTDLLEAEEADRIRRSTLHALAESSLEPSVETWKCRTRSGRSMDVETTSHSVAIQGQPCRLVVARLRKEERQPPRGPGTIPQADPLTGLPDRTVLLDRLRRRILQSRQIPGRRFAVLVADLDRFKLLNRSLGLEGANQVLVAVARRLEDLMHPDEMLVRLEGDAFAMLLEDVLNSEVAQHMAREVQEELEAPFTIGGQEIHLSASVGMALAGPEINQEEELLKNAEVALTDVKAQGIGGLRVFVPEMRARAANDLRMEKDLRPNIERGDLRPWFQPIVSLRTGLLAGFEALARWHHPELGIIMPSQFIPIAERTGIIVDLGKRVMGDACRQVCEWQSRFRSDPPLFVTVNCSMAQFLDPNLAVLVKWALANSGLSPKSLKLELTESVLMEDNPRTLRSLDRILGLGVQLIIDDFGTGYSSLSRLHMLPIEALKIDQSFVAGLVDRVDSLTMTRAIIQLARSFGLKVTAEGVETVEQLHALRKLECDFAQGYYFSKALEPDQAEQLLSSSRKW
ncbi:MAG TPA: EAL domain-containing protein [Planctomycetota bacterium]|nr:EAL domain-containing protein [Planctomycetota bacterium]